MYKIACRIASFACLITAFIMVIGCIWVLQGSKIEVQNWVIIHLCYGIYFAVEAKGEPDA